MGTWLTVEALRQMAIRDGHVASKINNVILASPDLDVDVFGRQFVSLGEERPHFTIFVSRDDRALGFRAAFPAMSIASARSILRRNPIAASSRRRASPSSISPSSRAATG
ncbi:hypothetical protein AJ87_04725 [Rhizobium yanglingense]|nr:hypothetical protein AJ87_04725 [Rhizobium yanglingense]